MRRWKKSIWGIGNWTGSSVQISPPYSWTSSKTTMSSSSLVSTARASGMTPSSMKKHYKGRRITRSCRTSWCLSHRESSVSTTGRGCLTWVLRGRATISTSETPIDPAVTSISTVLISPSSRWVQARKKSWDASTGTSWKVSDQRLRTTMKLWRRKRSLREMSWFKHPLRRWGTRSLARSWLRHQRSFNSFMTR